jgi:hypothetical protein
MPAGEHEQCQSMRQPSSLLKSQMIFLSQGKWHMMLSYQSQYLSGDNDNDKKIKNFITMEKCSLCE